MKLHIVAATIVKSWVKWPVVYHCTQQHFCNIVQKPAIVQYWTELCNWAMLCIILQFCNILQKHIRRRNPIQSWKCKRRKIVLALPRLCEHCPLCHWLIIVAAVGYHCAIRQWDIMPCQNNYLRSPSTSSSRVSLVPSLSHLLPKLPKKHKESKARIIVPSSSCLVKGNHAKWKIGASAFGSLDICLFRVCSHFCSTSNSLTTLFAAFVIKVGPKMLRTVTAVPIFIRCVNLFYCLYMDWLAPLVAQLWDFAEVSTEAPVENKIQPDFR